VPVTVGDGRTPDAPLPVSIRGGVAGAASARVERLAGRDAVVVRIDGSLAAGSLRRSDSRTVAEAASLALHQHLPLVGVFASGGAAVDEGIDALDAWGRAGGAMAACSGQVPPSRGRPCC